MRPKLCCLLFFIFLSVNTKCLIFSVEFNLKRHRRKGKQQIYRMCKINSFCLTIINSWFFSSFFNNKYCHNYKSTNNEWYSNHAQHVLCFNYKFFWWKKKYIRKFENFKNNYFHYVQFNMRPLCLVDYYYYFS